MPAILETILSALPFLLKGALYTAAIVIIAMISGLILGLPLAVLRVYGSRFLQLPISLYIWLLRGTPILVLLFALYMGLNISAFVASCLALALASSAYQCQIFKGALLAIPHGQLNAALALGMTKFQALKTIILPQALRISIPAWSNEYSIILKDSAIAFAIGTTDLMSHTHFVATRTYTYMPLYITTAILYFILTWIGIKLLFALHKKMHKPYSNYS